MTGKIAKIKTQIARDAISAKNLHNLQVPKYPRTGWTEQKRQCLRCPVSGRGDLGADTGNCGPGNESAAPGNLAGDIPDTYGHYTFTARRIGWTNTI